MQLIRGNPIRFGYKLLVALVDIVILLIYIRENPLQKNDGEDLPLGSRVVLDILDRISELASHQIYFDNLFTTRDLLIHLQQLGFRATGTLRENRLPLRPLNDSNTFGIEERSSFGYRFDPNAEIPITKWNDNNH
ncbi:Transposase IS4 [Popillia japonica]|uniref:Transposase IS4 n=1 Tax=Popillia japonica TaxID=7064 RepID=A0AAW1IZL0_POPJA